MKKLLFVLIVVTSCTQPQESASIDSSLQTLDVPDTISVHDDLGDAVITIKGNDIWVRDYPNTGKVIMKLNDGDRCAVIKVGRLDVIRGEAAYWFLVEHGSERGWVFGSQTRLNSINMDISERPVKSYDLIKHLTVKKADELLGAFQSVLKNTEIVAIENEENPETREVNNEGERVLINTPSREGIVEDEGAAVENETYKVGISNAPIQIVEYNYFMGAASVVDFNKSMIYVRQDDQLHLKGAVSGKTKQIISVAPNNYLILSDYAQMISGELLAGYTSSVLYNVKTGTLSEPQNLGYYFTGSFGGFEGETFFPHAAETSIEVKDGVIFLTVIETSSYVDVNYKVSNTEESVKRFYKFNTKRSLFEEYRQEEIVPIN